eukprot:scaffold918_cov126-Cylindrotheca_fusiformis.AAC.30
MSSTMNEWKLRTYKHNHSMLSGAAELSKRASDLEKPHDKTQEVIIDDRTVIFELVKNVTKLPTTDREERIQMQFDVKNVDTSKLTCWQQHRLRRWLMQFEIGSLTLIYLAAFVAVNAIFAGLWYIEKEKCCEDPSMTFSQTFDFAIQTSSTIGYGGYWPKGYFANFLVVMLCVLSMLLSTVYGGLLFFKFSTPEANIQFSNVIAMNNVMGSPCLEIRVGNADGPANSLISAEASLVVLSGHEYLCPDTQEKRNMSSKETLGLAVSSQHTLDGVWTLRHFIDEKSPLYGFRFDEFPANTIHQFQLRVKAVQKLTKGEIFAQTAYQVEDIMVGHRFEDQVVWEKESRKGYFDFAKMSTTVPSVVWYPKPTNIYRHHSDTGLQKHSA